MAVVKIRDRGPIILEVAEGEPLEVVDGSGRAYGLGGKRILALCRCGFSNNKPFCDGSHGPNGFDSCVQARDLSTPSGR